MIRWSFKTSTGRVTVPHPVNEAERDQLRTMLAKADRAYAAMLGRF